MKGQAQIFSSNSDEWTTPNELIKKLKTVFKFELDAAATDQNKICKMHYDVMTDGLKHPWTSWTWCNPPYSHVAEWLEKAHDEFYNFAANSVTLVPSRTDTIAWHEHVLGKAFVCFVKGRLKFGTATHSAPFPSAIIVHTDELTEEQSDLLWSLGVVYGKC
jgi:phage N-6-adenine-methyltransferase